MSFLCYEEYGEKFKDAAFTQPIWVAWDQRKSVSWVEWPHSFPYNWKKRGSRWREHITTFPVGCSSYDLGIYIQSNLVKMHRSSLITYLHLFTDVLPKRHEDMWRLTANVSPTFNSVLSWPYRCYFRMENRCVLHSIKTTRIFREQPEFQFYYCASICCQVLTLTYI